MNERRAEEYILHSIYQRKWWCLELDHIRAYVCMTSHALSRNVVLFFRFKQHQSCNLIHAINQITSVYSRHSFNFVCTFRPITHKKTINYGISECRSAKSSRLKAPIYRKCIHQNAFKIIHLSLNSAFNHSERLLFAFLIEALLCFPTGIVRQLNWTFNSNW